MPATEYRAGPAACLMKTGRGAGRKEEEGEDSLQAMAKEVWQDWQQGQCAVLWPQEKREKAIVISESDS